MPTPKQFYYQFDGSVIGPLTGILLREAAIAGQVVPVTLVATDPNGNWVNASRIRGLFDENGKPRPHPDDVQRKIATKRARDSRLSETASDLRRPPQDGETQQLLEQATANIKPPGLLGTIARRFIGFVWTVVSLVVATVAAFCTAIVLGLLLQSWPVFLLTALSLVPAALVFILFRRIGLAVARRASPSSVRRPVGDTSQPLSYPAKTGKLPSGLQDPPRIGATLRTIPKVDEMLDRWDEVREQGRSISIEELCRDCPELQEELRQKIRELEWVDDVMATQASAGIHEGDAWAIPEAAGRYRLDELIGQGGFGQVWQAYDPELERTVAVKILRPERQASFMQVERFLAEAKKVAKLSHNNIVPIHDAGRDGGLCYMVTDLIDGCDLAQMLKDGPVPTAEAVRIVKKISDALQHAHENGVIHRDVKPHNILIDGKREPYITDFGIAVTDVELVDGGADSAGTPAYMAPEQADLQSPVIDRRCDIYSLGVVLYELLSGESPYEIHTLSDLRTSVRTKQPRPLRSLVPTIPESLESVCMKALAKRPSDRYFTAKEMADALRGGEGTSRKTSLRQFAALASLIVIAGIVFRIVAYGIGDRSTGHERSNGRQLVEDTLTSRQRASLDRIHRALDMEAHFDYLDEPLRGVIQDISKTYDIPIVIDWWALDEIGIHVETPIIFKLEGITVGAAMKTMLEEIQLTYIIKEEVVHITTIELGPRSVSDWINDRAE